MIDEAQTERIKKAIFSIGTYEQVALKTKISVSTLVRITSGKTEPKFQDIAKIARLSGLSLDFLANGDSQSVKKQALKNADSRSPELTYVINNADRLSDDDVQAVSRHIRALLCYSDTNKRESKR